MSGSHVDFCPRPCPSTYQWARLATHRGSLHRLAHAAGHGYFSGGSTSRRSVSFCVKPFTSPKPRSKKMAINSSQRSLFSVRVSTRVSHPVGPACPATICRAFFNSEFRIKDRAGIFFGLLIPIQLTTGGHLCSRKKNQSM